MVTRRRMRTLCHDRGACVFGCSPTAEDAIEHYANCPVVADFAARRLRIPLAATPQDRLRDFLILDHANPANVPVLVTKKAIRTAAVYRTHCLVRLRHGKVQQGHEAGNALQQSAKEMARGHTGVTALLSNIYAHAHAGAH